MNELRGNPPPTGRPDCFFGTSCDICWGFTDLTPGILSRFFHRRKYGHNPVPGVDPWSVLPGEWPIDHAYRMTGLTRKN